MAQKTYAILGAGGSFGIHTAFYLLDHADPKKVIGVGRNPLRPEPFSLNIERHPRFRYHAFHVTYELDSVLEDVQHRLFDLGGILCVPGTDESAFSIMLDERVERLERLMDGWMEAQGPLEEFILPGGAPASAHLHVARCHVRRAEQLVMTLLRSEPINLASVRYLNRLSDALFVMAREVNRRGGVPDVTWKPAGPVKKGT